MVVDRISIFFKMTLYTVATGNIESLSIRSNFLPWHRRTFICEEVGVLWNLGEKIVVGADVEGGSISGGQRRQWRRKRKPLLQRGEGLGRSLPRLLWAIPTCTAVLLLVCFAWQVMGDIEVGEGDGGEGFGSGDFSDGGPGCRVCSRWRWRQGCDNGGNTA